MGSLKNALVPSSAKLLLPHFYIDDGLHLIFTGASETIDYGFELDSEGHLILIDD